jgi:hypothetical protein
MNVYGRLRMAPRAGFEDSRKLLNAHVVQCMYELNTPARTPRFSTWILDAKPASIRFQSRRLIRYRARWSAGFQELVIVSLSLGNCPWRVR